MLNRRKLAVSLLALSMASLARGHEVEIDPNPRPVVQVALLLDTSNSMDGLINQARTQLWKIVNEFNHTKKHGKAPKLEVALYEYGNNNLAAGEGYVRMVLPFTTDLDLISEKLWSLKTNGGSEYCGQVIHNAVNELKWSDDKKAYKAIFIAGNEPFTQGNMDYRSSCAESLAHGIIVNTIHCGPEKVGRDGEWDRGARLGEGKFLNIDQDRTCVAIAAPQDDEIAKLNAELNKTYIPYGDRGAAGRDNQRAQDDNAASAPGALVERAAAKASGGYSNAGWDLVDAARERKVDPSKLEESALPEAMRKMSADERAKFVADSAEQRARIQSRMNELSKERRAYVEAEERKQSAAGADTLDTAVLKAVREQLKAKEFEVN